MKWVLATTVRIGPHRALMTTMCAFGSTTALRRTLANNLSVRLGAYFEMVRVQNKPEHLVNSSNTQLLPSDFHPTYYSGTEMRLNYYNADKPANPTTGLWLSLLYLTLITFSYFNSEDGWWFQLKGGFAF